VLELALSLEDALRFRFTISPLSELVRLTRVIASPASFEQGAHVAWLRQHRLAVQQLEREYDRRQRLMLGKAGQVIAETDELASFAPLGFPRAYGDW
jgi:hypothetical protein